MHPNAEKKLQNFLIKGKTTEALAFLQNHRRRHPDDLDAHIHVAGILLQNPEVPADAFPAAAEALQAALKLAPGRIDLRYNLALVYQHLDQLPAAMAEYKAVLAQQPQHTDAARNLALLLRAQERHQAAETVIARTRATQEADPALAVLHGLLLAETGQLEAAQARFEALAAQHPSDPEINANLAMVRYQRGDSEGAFAQFLALWQRGHRPLALAQGFGNAAFATTRYTVALEAYAHACQLSDASYDWQNWRRAACRVSAAQLSHVDWPNLLTRVSWDPQPLAGVLWQRLSACLPGKGKDFSLETLLHSSECGVLQCALSTTIVCDRDTEAHVTELRASLLQAVEEATIPEHLSGAAKALAIALALQSIRNEYVFGVSDAEYACLQRLTAAKGGTDPGLRLAVMAAYCPPQQWEKAEAPWPQALQQHIADQMREQRLTAEVEPLITQDHEAPDTVSKAVRAHYESNPYPRWQRLDHPETQAPVTVLRHLFSHHRFADDTFPASPAILIAGCGTGKQAAAAAMRYRDAEILAFDLSKASLAHAQLRAQDLGLQNITFRHGDILSLPQVDKCFDIIECVGVLHHMADPVSGWQILRDRLTAHGFMKIGLYSRLGRADVNHAKDMIQQAGFSDTPDDIRRARQWLSRQMDPQLAPLFTSLDFYTLSECRDLLFHQHELQFDIPEIARILDRLSLTFLGFEAQGRDQLQAFRQEFPQSDTADLRAWARFETQNPNCFREMYQFWCRAEG